MHPTFDPMRRAGLRRFWTVVAVAVGLYALLPLIWVLSSSLKPAGQIFAGLSPLTPAVLFPTSVTVDNYADLATSPFPLALFNSLFVVTVTVAVGLAMSALAGWGLAVYRFRGRGALFAIVVISFLIPFDAVALPLSELFRDWGLGNSYLGLILPGIGNGFAVFLLRQFFLAVPRELIEAARVDGLREFQIFARIVLPMSKPALISAAQLIFVFQWQSFLWPLLIATDPRLTVAPVALASFIGQFEVNFGLMFAGCVLTVVVPVIVLLYAQRSFTESVATSGTKG